MGSKIVTGHTRGAVTWQRLPYKAGKKILTVVALSVLSALSANGMIGQTPEEVEQEARRDKNTLSIDHGRCGSLPTLTVLYRAVGCHLPYIWSERARDLVYDVQHRVTGKALDQT